ncbi:MAG: hypothetical protein AAFV87_09375, partial [Pseudomonadota bacterium]
MSAGFPPNRCWRKSGTHVPETRSAAFRPGCDLDVATILENADIALYASKHAGRAQMTFYRPDLRNNN